MVDVKKAQSLENFYNLEWWTKHEYAKMKPGTCGFLGRWCLIDIKLDFENLKWWTWYESLKKARQLKFSEFKMTDIAWIRKNRHGYSKPQIFGDF